MLSHKQAEQVVAILLGLLPEPLRANYKVAHEEWSSILFNTKNGSQIWFSHVLKNGEIEFNDSIGSYTRLVDDYGL